MNRSTILAALVAVSCLTVELLGSGVCRIDYQTKNKSRYVHGPVNVECGLSSGEVHSAPFGNWGVDTESTDRRDGHQFDGWCRGHRVCEDDDPDDCTTYCNGSWLQWNSCTTNIPKYAAPNEDFFNYDNGRQQKNKYSSVNAHGGGRTDIVVSCPTDTDGDYYPDEGGCEDVLDRGFSIGGHRMELYELDGWIYHNPFFHDDDAVGTLRFPTLRASTSGIRCDIFGCTGGRDGAFQSKKSGSTTKVSAKAAIQITGAEFEDAFGSCCDPLSDPGCLEW